MTPAKIVSVNSEFDLTRTLSEPRMPCEKIKQKALSQ
jgi:hypothetical protein